MNVAFVLASAVVVGAQEYRNEYVPHRENIQQSHISSPLPHEYLDVPKEVSYSHLLTKNLNQHM